jgi:hypothetical protein
MSPEEAIAAFLDNLYEAMQSRNWDNSSSAEVMIAATPEVVKHYLKGQ